MCVCACVRVCLCVRVWSRLALSEPCPCQQANRRLLLSLSLLCTSSHPPFLPLVLPQLKYLVLTMSGTALVWLGQTPTLATLAYALPPRTVRAKEKETSTSPKAEMLDSASRSKAAKRNGEAFGSTPSASPPSVEPAEAIEHSMRSAPFSAVLWPSPDSPIQAVACAQAPLPTIRIACASVSLCFCPRAHTFAHTPPQARRLAAAPLPCI